MHANQSTYASDRLVASLETCAVVKQTLLEEIEG